MSFFSPHKHYWTDTRFHYRGPESINVGKIEGASEETMRMFMLGATTVTQTCVGCNRTEVRTQAGDGRP